MNKLSAKDLQNRGSESLERFADLIRKQNFDKACETAQDIIDVCISVSRNNTPNDEDRRKDIAFVLGVMFRGLQDFAELGQSLSSPDWIKNKQLIDTTWIQFCNARERMQYVSFCEHEVLDSIIGDLEAIEEWFLDLFGPGLYMSPVIKIERETCNICGKDFRACEHITGTLYDGIMCTLVPHGLELKGASIVRRPADPRCRVWPWNNQDDGKAQVRMLTTFRLDDFLEEKSRQTS